MEESELGCVVINQTGLPLTPDRRSIVDPQ
jgi:hypothetical protein